MTFSPVERHSYAKQSAEEQRRIALSMQPFYQQESANRQYEAFLAKDAGKELGLLAAAISPDGAFGQAVKQFQTRRELTNLANAAEAELRSDTGSHRIVPLDELKERSVSIEAAYELSLKLKEDGADPETVAAIREATGQSKINLATDYVKNLIPMHNAFLADRLANDERWIQLDTGDKFQINAYNSPSQFKAAVRQLTHEFNQNNGVYGLKPAFLAETGYVTGYEKNEADAIAAHGKTWKKDSEQRGINEAWKTNINNYEIDPTLFNANTILSAYRNSTNSKGEKLGNKEAIDEMFKYVEALYDLDPRAASNIADLLGTATYDIAGRPTKFSEKRVDALRSAIDAKLSGDIDRELGDKERARLLLNADFESGNIDEKEYNELWTQAGYAGPPVGIQRRNANEAATPSDEKDQMLASIQANGTLGIELNRVHPENYEWAKEQYEKLNKFNQAKNHSDANDSIKIIDGRIGTITGWADTNRLEGEIGPTVSLMAKRDFYKELKRFTLEGLPISAAIDAARTKVLERLGNPETPDELEKGYYYRLSKEDSTDAYSVVSFKMGELGKEKLDFSKPWTGENAPDVEFLRDLPTSDIADIAGYVGPDYKGKTPEIVTILFKKWKKGQPWFSTLNIDSKDFARRLAEGLGIEVAPPTPKEKEIKEVVDEATKDNELISRCIGRCTDNPSPGAAFEFKVALRLEKDPSVANSNELLAWDYS